MAGPIDYDKLSKTPHSGSIGLIAVEIKVDRSILDIVDITLSDSIPIFTSFISVAIFLTLNSS